MSKNVISIIMSAYCAEATIRESIESVIAQTYSTWELIVINDASTDATGEIAEAFAEYDDRICVLSNETNQGIATSRNKGISHASGEYLAFLDSDDIWHESKLEKQLRQMTETNAKISFTATAYINTAGQASEYILEAEEKFTYKNLLRRNIMSCSSIMVRRDCMIPFPKGFMHEDYAVWLQILKNTHQAHGLNEPLLIYRLGENTKSSNRISSAKMAYFTYRHVGFGKLAAAIFTLRYALHSISKRSLIKRKTGRLSH